MIIRLSKLIVIMVLFMFVFSCGKKGPPTIKDLPEEHKNKKERIL